MAKSFDEWSARAKQIGINSSRAAYQGYLNNIGASEPRKAPPPKPAAPKPKLYGKMAANEPSKAPPAPARSAPIPSGAKSFEAWSGRAKELGWSPESSGRAAYEGYLNNLRSGRTATPAPAPASSAPTPASEAPQTAAYEGPAPQDWRTFDPTPVGIEQLEPLMSEVVTHGPRSEVVENRVASLVDTNSPLFRAASGQAMRRMNASGMANSSMAQEAVMDSILKVAVPIAMADAQTFNRQRMLNQGITNEFRAAQNAAFFGQMQARLSGAINETLQHIAGGYALTQTKINDLTKRYGIDVGAATQIYGIDVGADTQKYVADLQFKLGMEGVKVDASKIMSDIQDNPDAAAQIWDMIFGNNMNPTDWYATWVNPFQS